MASHQDYDRITTMQSQTFQNQPAAVEGSIGLGDELLAESDEPPDEQQRTPRPTPVKPAPLDISAGFSKTVPNSLPRHESLLTQALHSESDSQSDEEHHVKPKRGLSTASTWSNVSCASTDLTSDGGFTSPGTRTSSPSPPLPATIHGLPPLFANKKDSDATLTLTIRHDEHNSENIAPLQKKSNEGPGENAVEFGLGRKRCITFACGKKDNNAAASPPKPQSPPTTEEKPAEPAPRRCTIKFACNAKATSSSGKIRCASPPPPRRLAVPSKGTPRSHRDSDSTVRNESPKSVRKPTPPVRHSRKYSENSDIGRCEATRFHEFASSEEEVEEWTQEQTCHKSRLTVSDTLKLENGLRKLGEEVEEEALEDEEEEEEDDELLDDDDEDLDEEEEEEDDDDEDNDEDDNASVASYGSVSDGGFQTDDEGGFAVSDDESDAGSDYQWWAPGRTAVGSSDQPEHIRPSAGHRSLSESSTGSIGSASGAGMFSKNNTTPPKKRKPVNIRPRSPELPDSTDFVCGTLDEDRPLEEAYYSALEQRRAAKHITTPQDIDPTFPTSDPEMDEEDEDEEVEAAAEDSDQHMLMHGQLDHIDEVGARGRRRTGSKRSPISSPKRLRSPPPPVKRGQAHRSPPPRRLFGQSPRRLRSPPPAGRLRSPPPTRRTSLAVTSKQQQATIQFAGMAQRHPPMFAASLPRPPTLFHQVSYDDDEETESTNDTLKRGPMDIKAGTALKRQRRKEKLYQKHCRKACKEKERRPAPGKGAERMREVGIGLAAYRGKKATPVHVLSY